MEISKNTVLFFDMDGTLIDTNYSNFLSYEKAIKSVTKKEKIIAYNPNERFNRTNLKSVLPNISSIDYLQIIQLKEEYYKNHLNYTKLNESVAKILLQYSRTNKTVLVTNSRENRAILTLDYHNLTDKFCNLFFRKTSEKHIKINKYENAISIMNLSAQNIIVFENESQEIDDAIKAGVATNNIISI